MVALLRQQLQEEESLSLNSAERDGEEEEDEEQGDEEEEGGDAPRQKCVTNHSIKPPQTRQFKILCLLN